MTTFELLDFTEAKDLVKVGRFQEALPKLYRLAGSYPQDQEIQDLIKLCLNVQQPQPVYSMPVPVYQSPQPQPKLQSLELTIKNIADKNKLLINVVSIIALVLTFCIVVYFGSYMINGHPPTVGLFYKEYSNVTEVYKGAALGDRVKVTINARDGKPVNGIIQVSDANFTGVVFRISTFNKNQLQLFPGRNIVYCYVSERLGSAIYCDIEEVQI